jgi:hypothetical protein
MKSIKTLALAMVFAAGTSAFSLAEEAAPDSIANQEPVYGAWFDTATIYAPQTVTTAGSFQVPASQWIAERFVSTEENQFRRAEATAVGGSGSSAGE